MAEEGDESTTVEPSMRSNAVAKLRRAASQRELRDGASSPASGRSTPVASKADSPSDRARELSLAKLTGASPSPEPGSPLPSLEEIQRRKGMTSPTPTSKPSPLAREEARSNLIRKLSRSDSKKGARKAAEEEVQTPSEPTTPTARRQLIRDQTSETLADQETQYAAAQNFRSHFADRLLPNTPPTPLSPESSPTETLASRISAAPSEFRAYRHTMERDRDSTLARLVGEDNFEFEGYRSNSSSGVDYDASPRFPTSPNIGASPYMPNNLPSKRDVDVGVRIVSDLTAGSQGDDRGIPILLGDSPSLNGTSSLSRLSVTRDSFPVSISTSGDTSTYNTMRTGTRVGLGLADSASDAEDELEGPTSSKHKVQGAFPRPEPGYRFPVPALSSHSSHDLGSSSRPVSPANSRRVERMWACDNRITESGAQTFVRRNETATPPLGRGPPDHVPSASYSPTRERSSSLVAMQHSRGESDPATSIPARTASRKTQAPPPRIRGKEHGRGESATSLASTSESIPSSSSYSLRNPSTLTSGSSASYRDDSVTELLVPGDYSDSESDFDQTVRRRAATDAEPAKNRILAKLGSILSTAPSGGSTHLDSPPRKLLLHAPVLQVVNANTVKDRYLLLFNDILLIAKPLIQEDSNTKEVISPNLDTCFLVKSIVELHRLKLTAQRDEDAAVEDGMTKKKHPLLIAFNDRFGNNPNRAITQLVTKGGISNDAATIANLLFRSPELNRSQLGIYLSSRESKHVLKAYVERFRLNGARIEDALRVLLASLRLPNDLAAAEHLLHTFAGVWSQTSSSLGQDVHIAQRLVIAMMELNDFLHSGIEDETGALGNLFGFPNPAVSVDDFIGAFRSKDPAKSASDEALTRIYMSIRKERLQQAADNGIASITPEIPVTLSPARMPARLTYRVPTEYFSITIPRADPKLSIRLAGNDLRVEPSVLSFAKSRTQSFRVTGHSLGHKTLLFVKLGPHASHYTGLPVNKVFSIERAFMRHTFQLAFVNHLGIKRKYMFSMSDAQGRGEWVGALHSGAEMAASNELPPVPANRAAIAARMVALQVLRDAVIAPEEATPLAKPGQAKIAPTSLPYAGRPSSSKGAHARSNSFSKTYAAGAGRAEADMGVSATLPPPGDPSRPGAFGQRRGSRDDTTQSTTAYAKSGNDLVLLAQQNSLLPTVLGLMNALHPSAPDPLGPSGTALRLTGQAVGRAQ